MSQPGATHWSDRLAVFDLETTGVDVTTSRIVTAHIGVIGPEGEQLESWSWLADPGVEIPAGATAVHGITTERARAEGRPAREVVAEIADALRALLARPLPLVVYNAAYDLSLLEHEALRHGVEPLASPAPVVDPLVIDKAVDRYRRGKRTLEAAAAHYGVALTGAHDAAADAIAAGRVAQALARKHEAALPDDIAALHGAQVSWHDQQCDSFEDYMRRERDHRFTADRGWPVRL
ncbi:3'-5' exonuclease [Microcella alkalica]|uniref:DNA polymerase-3 subunit epsilon n=1 Tax=Microcella alkalica TaxID=355930 RepID=A0A839E454_9MICO|nr:exonuclease domain-containing protein [Microcella alkalica]MBA8847151.1 DNA polymerase-3 subunit epsilon [Microcella alkalica]